MRTDFSNGGVGASPTHLRLKPRARGRGAHATLRGSIILFALLVAFNARADDPTPIPLWPDGAPGTLGKEAKDTPTITPYVPESGATGAAMVILPGGGYAHLSTTEGKDYALFLNQHGMTCFVV